MPSQTQGSASNRGEAPRKEAAGLTSGPTLPSRRSFLVALVGLAATALTIVLATPYVRFLLYPVFTKASRNKWSSLGLDDQFSSLTAPLSHFVTVRQDDGWLEATAKKAVYVTKNAQGQVEVLTGVCPHLGCTVQWRPAKGEFICPCHGSVFAPDGTRIAGPAPRGMDSLPIKTVNGNLMVRYENFRQLLPFKEVVS